MTLPFRKSVFIKFCLQLFNHVKIQNSFSTTSTNLIPKKHFRMKNKFTFQNELRQIAKADSKRRTLPSELFSEDTHYGESFDNSSCIGHGFISSDLLPENKKAYERKVTLPAKGKNRKPSLTYQGEILYGVHPVYLALQQKKRIFHHLYTREDLDAFVEEDISRKGKIIELARSMNIPVSFLNSRGLRILAPGVVHQGICLDAGFLPLPEWDENELDSDASQRKPLWLILDEILDPMNVGAIIRSACYFGVNKLFTVRGNSCKLSPTVSKASSGTLEVMDIYQIGNLEDFIKRRKENGWSIVSTMAYSSANPELTRPLISANQFNTSKPTILILGNEGKGIPQHILRLCDSLISIEPGQILPEGLDSLNVSVATGVLLYVLSNSNNIKR